MMIIHLILPFLPTWIMMEKLINLILDHQCHMLLILIQTMWNPTMLIHLTNILSTTYILQLYHMPRISFRKFSGKTIWNLIDFICLSKESLFRMTQWIVYVISTTKLGMRYILVFWNISTSFLLLTNFPLSQVLLVSLYQQTQIMFVTLQSKVSMNGSVILLLTFFKTQMQDPHKSYHALEPHHHCRPPQSTNSAQLTQATQLIPTISRS